MCKSLAEGGLRCFAHVQNDLVRIEKEYHEGLQDAAQKAGVPFSENTLRKVKTAYEAEMTEEKEKLLLAHKSAVEAQQGRTFTAGSTSSLPAFSSVGHDLASVRKKIKARFDRLVDIAEGAPSNSEILENNPALNMLQRKSDYIDAIHLHKHYENQMMDLHEKIRNSAGFSSTSRMSDFPEEKRQLDVISAQKEALEEYMQPLRQEYSSHQRAMPYDSKAVAVMEYNVTKTPRPKTAKKLDAAIKANVFKKLKENYTTRANRGYNSYEEVENHAKKHNDPIYDDVSLIKFKSEVYDKAGAGADLKQRIGEKKKQLQLTPTYRNDLAIRADLIQKNHPAKAQELLERKRILDKLAEKEMDKNRARAAARGLKAKA